LAAKDQRDSQAMSDGVSDEANISDQT